jgi:hypothetical protein
LDFFPIKKHDNPVSSWIFKVKQETNFILQVLNHWYPSGTIITDEIAKKRMCQLYGQGVIIWA